MQIRQDIQKLYEKVKAYREYFHQYPELGLDTLQTKEYIKNILEKAGCDVIKEGYAEQGIVGIYHKDGKEGVLIRSDMDALPIQEDVIKESSSKVLGVMHACGHDGHMAALLGLCEYLHEHKHRIKKRIVCLFQPGEEGPGGAKRIIEEGLLEEFPCAYAFATHLMPQYEMGKIACREGAMMAQNAEVEITIQGIGGHGAYPDTGRDAILAAASFLLETQTQLNKRFSTFQERVFHIGEICGGDACNTICDKVYMRGTLRTFDEVLFQQVQNCIMNVASAMEKLHDVTFIVRWNMGYDPVYNDPHMCTLLKKVVKDSYIEADKQMTSEDFSFFLKQLPGLMFYTGCKMEKVTSLHTATFDFDEHALLNTIETYVCILEELGILV